MEKVIATACQALQLGKLITRQERNGQFLGDFDSSQPARFLAELKAKFDPSLINRPQTFTTTHHLGGNYRCWGFTVHCSTDAFFTVVHLNPTGDWVESRFLFTNKGGFFKNNFEDDDPLTAAVEETLINIMAMGASADYTYFINQLGTIWRESVGSEEKDALFRAGVEKLIASFDSGFSALEMALEREIQQRRNR